jgi:hypothetical protein
LDKDLVLPPVMDAGQKQTYFVVASTDLERSEIMMTRIREQLEKCADLKTSGSLKVTATKIPLPEEESGSVEHQIHEVANGVTEMIRSALGVSFPPVEPKEQSTTLN